LSEKEHNFGLQLNKDKTVFTTDVKSLDGVTENEGIKRVEETKSLGVTVALNRQMLIDSQRLRLNSSADS
jgi:hypothetical protein